MNSDDRPSKSELKRAAHAQQSLGRALAALPDAALAATPMDESLRSAIDALRRTRSHEGRRRQLQYIGKLMRTTELAPLQEAVAAAALGGARDALALHRGEQWRNALVADDAALTRWMAQHPHTDLQRLRALVRDARRDAALPPGQRHGHAWRALFRFLKPHLAQTS